MPKLLVHKDFFKTWSPNMAYILGIITTGGCLLKYKNGCNGIDITSKDKELLEDIKKTLGAEHKIGSKLRGYRIQIRNKSIYDDLLNLGLTPNKSKTIRFPSVPINYLSDFIRGCFDGDGGITVWKEKRWQNSWQIRTTFTSASPAFLIPLKEKLAIYGKLRKGKIWHKDNRRAYELHYGIEDSMYLYNFIYNKGGTETNFLYLKRKKEKFEYFFKIKSVDKNKYARVAELADALA